MPTGCACDDDIAIAPMAQSERDGMPPGPITRYTAKVYWIQTPDGVLRTFTTTNGRTVVYTGELVTMDSTQKGESSSRPCAWVNDPRWSICDRTCAFRRKYNGNAFLMQLFVDAPGEAVFHATVDGVDSNELTLEAH
jgi:hypothetical protein